MKHIATVLFWLFSTAQLIAAEKKHVVFFIHGLYSDSTAFCDTPKFLKQSFEDHITEFVMVDYKTHSDSQSIRDFSHLLAEKISKKLKGNLQTEYSIVAHSQGGLVALEMIRRCLLQKNCAKDFPKNLKQLTTLGAPIWGSPNANFFDRQWLFHLTKPLSKDLVGTSLKSIIPTAQLTDLTTGSNVIQAIRSSFLKQKNFWQKIKMVNIGGETSRHRRKLVKSSKLFERFRNRMRIHYSDQFETDFVVPPSSAQLDFLYYIESKSESGVIESIEGFNDMAEKVDYYISPHTGVYGAIGMACFEEKEKASEKVFSRLQNSYAKLFHLSPLSTEPLSNVENSNFSVEIQFVLPPGHKRRLPLKRKWIKISEDSSNLIAKTTLEDTIFDGISLSRIQLLSFTGKRPLFVHHGDFKRDYLFKSKKSEEKGTRSDNIETAALTYKVNIPGWEPREFTLKVSPGYNTYAEIVLTPKNSFSDLW